MENNNSGESAGEVDSSGEFTGGMMVFVNLLVELRVLIRQNHNFHQQTHQNRKFPPTVLPEPSISAVDSQLADRLKYIDT